MRNQPLVTGPPAQIASAIAVAKRVERSSLADDTNAVHGQPWRVDPSLALTRDRLVLVSVSVARMRAS
jgi:hypothetical protein